ncbi:hypothetical protein SUGI_0972430 [Cryptomeria japonica]|uniref:probable methyltransferase At1g29790 n=1 Tax=Cryptomeria japonica TaxID=3369 RepID=UPI0024147AB1|nr:probable methyltransferase At1g29790 [Cryptomeria japonica]GLJ46161.1 hypothetical protein SUGI_0972430 [Cryptomeria japonica]
MEINCLRRCKCTRIFLWVQFVLGLLVVIVSSASLVRFYTVGILFNDDDLCRHFHRPKEVFSEEVSSRLRQIHLKVQNLHTKLEQAVKDMESNAKSKDPNALKAEYIEHRSFLEVDVMGDLEEIRLSTEQQQPKEQEPADPLQDFFLSGELKMYIRKKENRLGKINILGTTGTYTSIGHACVVMKKEVEQYMSYDIGGYCKDDWNLAQKLLLQGCDPLPRRRCLVRAPRQFQKPLPINESLWKIPDDRNVRWNNYQCKNFDCLTSNKPNKGFSKCSGCFNLAKNEATKWVRNSSMNADFLIAEVLRIKPGEVRIGLDFSVGTGTFAARMREHNVTIVSAAINLGAPFNEMIALRGLVPLYITINQRLPFFDNTLDLIHTGGLLDAWIDLQLLDFIIFDWDRVLRPGGFLWVDKFFCTRADLDDYLYMFLQLRYKKHKWVVTPKNNKEVYFSALLEKSPRPI